MAKLTLNDVVAGYKATTAINANSAATEAAMEKTLSRDGTGPNTMTADLDMNGNNILNSGNALGAVTSVSGTAPIAVSGTITPTVSITASTTSAAGSMSAADKTKLDAISGTNTGDQTNITGNAATVTTNANLTGHVTSSGNATTLGSFTSTELRSALTNETGTGVAVFATSPTIASPTMTSVDINSGNIDGTVIGAASAAAITATNVTASGLVTGDAVKVMNGSNSSRIESASSGTLTWTLPDATDTAVGLDATQTLTHKTINGAVIDQPVITLVDINSGNIDGTVIGSASAAAITATDVTATGTVTVPTPSNNTDAATKAYVDTIKQGSIDIKDSVRVASTANIAIASALTNGSTIDGVTVATGNRVLLKNQTDASENGIYAVVASGAASRTVDANTNTLVTNGMYTFVSEGTASNATGYVLTTLDPITLDTTNLTFTQFSGAGQIDAGAGLTKTGNTLDVVGTSGRIVANANTVDIGSDVALVANPLSQFGATTSAQLKGVLSDETGSGAAVFATSPTLVTPALGTPASGVVTNLTGTASININGTVGASSATTIAATTISATNVTASGFVGTGATDAIKLPVGTTAQQPTPATGMLRFNSTETTFEGYDGSDWGEIGGGGDGALGFSTNVSTVAANYTLATGSNASSVGPMTVATGVSVTIPTGSRWVIL
jgi:hypothetical protein